MKKHFISGWYALYTKPNYEKKVSAAFIEKNIDHHLPLNRTIKTLRDRKKLVEVPMFPSYIFVYLSGTQDYTASLEISGAITYVRLGKQIARVDDVIVNNLKIMAANSGNLEISVDEFESGQQLVIKNGPLSGLYCEAVHYRGKKKLLVRIAMLNRNILVDMSVDFLTGVI